MNNEIRFLNVGLSGLLLSLYICDEFIVMNVPRSQQKIEDCFVPNLLIEKCRNKGIFHV